MTVDLWAGEQQRLIYTSKANRTPGTLDFLKLAVKAEELKISSRPGSCRKNREIRERGPEKAGTGSGE